MKTYLKTGLIIGLAVFLLLFLIRLIYEYRVPPVSEIRVLRGISLNDNLLLNNKNYASTKLKVTTAQKEYHVDQKYEKIASIKAKTVQMEEDEKKARNFIKEFNALIQYEQSSGLKKDKNRVITLAIGVPPKNFDELVGKISAVGTLREMNIDKRDKTNEYKNLIAKKASYNQIRNSLLALKNKGGKIEEFIQLENRILEIEKEIQTLGISLGEFDQENEFCTVNFSLAEDGGPAANSFFKIIMRSFEWTVKYYALCLFIFFILILGTLVMVHLLMKLSWVKEFINKT